MAPETTKVVPLTCHGHSRPVTHISFSAITDDDQYYLISACKDNNPMLRDGITGDWIGTFIGHKGAVWQARLSADANIAATASADFSARVWDTHTGEALYTLQHNHIVRSVAFPDQPSPQFLATGGAEKKLRIFDLTRASVTVNGGSGTPSRTASPAAGATNGATNGTTEPANYEVGAGVHGGTIKSILWTPHDVNVLITAADDKKIRWWDLRSREAISSYEVDAPIGSCELNTISHPDANTNGDNNGNSASILSVAAGKKVYFFDGTSRPNTEPLVTHTLPHEAASVALHPAARKFVTGGGGDTWTRVYDMDTAEELEIGKGHHGPVWSVCFSPDGRLYATGSEDGTVKLWKWGEGGYGLWR